MPTSVEVNLNELNKLWGLHSQMDSSLVCSGFNTFFGPLLSFIVRSGQQNLWIWNKFNLHLKKSLPYNSNKLFDPIVMINSPDKHFLRIPIVTLPKYAQDYFFATPIICLTCLRYQLFVVNIIVYFYFQGPKCYLIFLLFHMSASDKIQNLTNWCSIFTQVYYRI